MSKSKVWFITSISNGFGRSLTKAVLAKGNRVFATASDTAQLRDLAGQYPNNLRIVRLDLTKPESIGATVETALATFNSIDVLCNIAGYNNLDAMERINDEKIPYQFGINYFGTLNSTQALLLHLRQKRSGHIFNVSSVTDFACLPRTYLRFVTKYAIERFSQALAKELAPLGIKLTIVEAGGLPTNFTRDCLIPNNQINDYAGIPDRSIEQVKTKARQSNNFDSVVEAMIEAVYLENPPLHLISEKNVSKGNSRKKDFFPRKLEKTAG